mgnify:CR=1 FL=1
MAACDKIISDNEMDNCKKNCLRGWWEETKCIGKPLSTRSAVYANKTYKIPFGINEKFTTDRSTQVQSRTVSVSTMATYLSYILFIVAILLGVFLIIGE